MMLRRCASGASAARSPLVASTVGAATGGGPEATGLSQSTRGLQRRLLTTDGYLHHTTIPTYHFQSSLPKLPLPKLDTTLERYLASVAPLATADQLGRARQAAEAFAAGVGRELHEELAAYNKQHYSSYISVNLAA